MAVLRAALLFSFACVEGLRISKANALSFWSAEEGTAVVAPLNQAEVDYLEASGQRAEMLNVLTKLNGKSIVFIGDSVIRNQYDGLCLLLGAKHSAADMRKISDEAGAMDKCDGKNISAAFVFTSHPTSTALSELLSGKAIRQPSVIYWDASQKWAKYSIARTHNYFQLPVYRKLVEEAAQTYTKDAPNAEMVFFLSHSRSNIEDKSSSVSDNLMIQLNGICQETMQAHKDGQGRSIKIVDGFGFTKNKAGWTTDGVHYNKLVWEELKMMLQQLGK